ncbi:hypothetical protein GALMADRAFT_146404 [Galerina marginata CBS 339.88]|uniref:HTH La-type RNA-binding domain-containing protein n=1 Tax=Galerina marginata (strain CBS 339.88) TaxID=685588 RepID=A0A067SER1_GALM3|nr:hypothetical protein GALMADRAFT_146404 [Galerina marginata CBS 339.88]
MVSPQPVLSYAERARRAKNIQSPIAAKPPTQSVHENGPPASPKLAAQALAIVAAQSPTKPAVNVWNLRMAAASSKQNDDPFVVRPDRIPRAATTTTAAPQDQQSWPQVGTSEPERHSLNGTTSSQPSTPPRKNEKTKWVLIPPEELQAAADAALKSRATNSHSRNRSNHLQPRNPASTTTSSPLNATRPQSQRTSATHSRVHSRSESLQSSPRVVRGRRLPADDSNPSDPAAPPTNTPHSNSNPFPPPLGHGQPNTAPAFYPSTTSPPPPPHHLPHLPPHPHIPPRQQHPIPVVLPTPHPHALSPSSSSYPHPTYPVSVSVYPHHPAYPPDGIYSPGAHAHNPYMPWHQPPPPPQLPMHHGQPEFVLHQPQGQGQGQRQHSPVYPPHGPFIGPPAHLPPAQQQQQQQQQQQRTDAPQSTPEITAPGLGPSISSQSVQSTTSRKSLMVFGSINASPPPSPSALSLSLPVESVGSVSGSPSVSVWASVNGVNGGINGTEGPAAAPAMAKTFSIGVDTTEPVPARLRSRTRTAAANANGNGGAAGEVGAVLNGSDTGKDKDFVNGSEEGTRNTKEEKDTKEKENEAKSKSKIAEVKWKFGTASSTPPVNGVVSLPGAVVEVEVGVDEKKAKVPEEREAGQEKAGDDGGEHKSPPAPTPPSPPQDQGLGAHVRAAPFVPGSGAGSTSMSIPMPMPVSMSVPPPPPPSRRDLDDLVNLHPHTHLPPFDDDSDVLEVKNFGFGFGDGARPGYEGRHRLERERLERERLERLERQRQLEMEMEMERLERQRQLEMERERERELMAWQEDQREQHQHQHQPRPQAQQYQEHHDRPYHQQQQHSSYHHPDQQPHLEGEDRPSALLQGSLLLGPAGPLGEDGIGVGIGASLLMVPENPSPSQMAGADVGVGPGPQDGASREYPLNPRGAGGLEGQQQPVMPYGVRGRRGYPGGGPGGGVGAGAGRGGYGGAERGGYGPGGGVGERGGGGRRARGMNAFSRGYGRGYAPRGGAGGPSSQQQQRPPPPFSVSIPCAGGTPPPQHFQALSPLSAMPPESYYPPPPPSRQQQQQGPYGAGYDAYGPPGPGPGLAHLPPHPHVAPPQHQHQHQHQHSLSMPPPQPPQPAPGLAHGQLPHIFPPVPPPLSTISFPLDPTRYWLLGQLEYYLSPQNMAQDFFLRQRMDARGWIPIALLASFNRVKQLTPDAQLVRDVLTLSSLVQVRGSMVRMGGWDRFVLPDAAPSSVEDTPLPYMYQTLGTYAHWEEMKAGEAAQMQQQQEWVHGLEHPHQLQYQHQHQHQHREDDASWRPPPHGQEGGVAGRDEQNADATVVGVDSEAAESQRSVTLVNGHVGKGAQHQHESDDEEEEEEDVVFVMDNEVPSWSPDRRS